MSLLEPGTGILGTNMSWDDLEVEMQKAFKTTAKFGEKKNVTDIGDMKGMFSKVGLVDPDWVNFDKSESEPKLPEKLVVKIPTLVPLVTVMKMMGNELNEEKKLKSEKIIRTYHNREVAVYKILEKEANPRIPITKIYALKPFSDDKLSIDAFIISEYIPNVANVGLHESIPVEELISAVRSAAAFSALGEKLTEEIYKIAGGPDSLKNVMSDFFDEENLIKMSGLIRVIFPAELAEKVDKFHEVYKVYTDIKMADKYVTISEFCGHKPVLSHSDLWNNNLLCTKENGKFVLKAVIDFQTVSVCGPGQDLSRLITACLSNKDRRENAEILLENYYESFVEKLDGRPVPYTFEQLKKSYRLYFPLMAILIIPLMATPLMHLDKSQPEVAELIVKPSMEKMIGLLEDVIKVHAENVQQFPEFFKI